VTNSSINVPGWWASIVDFAYAAARDAGVVNFAATGNDGLDQISYPASSTSVNAVGAVSQDGSRAWFSNRGTGLDFMAPGVGIVTTDRVGPGGYNATDYVMSASGTSFASPYAAGVAALMLASNPGLSPAELEQMMRESCVDLGDPGYDTTFGWGLVNANYSVQAARPGVWIHFGYAGTQTGSFVQPYNSLANGVGNVPPGGNLTIKSGSTSEAIVITTPMTIRAWRGTGHWGISGSPVQSG
jgi:subtilisin family serine protease